MSALPKAYCSCEVPDLSECGTCGYKWCNKCHPTPGARTPCEYDHDDYPEEEEPDHGSEQDHRAYTAYIQANLDRIEAGGWTPIAFQEFLGSEERDIYLTR